MCFARDHLRTVALFTAAGEASHRHFPGERLVPLPVEARLSRALAVSEKSESATLPASLLPELPYVKPWVSTPCSHYSKSGATEYPYIGNWKMILAWFSNATCSCSTPILKSG